MNLARSHIPSFARIREVFLEEVQEALQKKLTDFMVEQKDEFIKRVKSQDFFTDAPPLSEEYLKWKKRLVEAGYIHTADIMLYVGTYMQSLQVHLEAEQRGYTSYIIRIDPEATQPKIVPSGGGYRTEATQRTVEEVAQMNEYGTSHIPARPHWGKYAVVFAEQAAALKPELANIVKSVWSTTLRGNV